MKEQVRKALTLALVLAFLCGLSYSQSKETGALEGKVEDTEGNVLPGVEITIASPQMIGGNQSRITNASGAFRFVLLQPGTFSIEARLEGFAPQRREAVRLFVGQTLTVDFVLEIGRLEEEVVVIAQSPLIDVKDSQLSTTELDEMALNDVVYDHEMYIFKVIELAPGTTPVYHGSSAYGGTARSGNSYLLDGVEIANPAFGSSWGIPDAQAMSEARVYGLGAPAEFDGFTGVQLSMLVKSGGNTFDGMIQVFYNDYDWITENFDLNDHPLYSVPQEHSYNDGRAAIGGPLIQDKLWFYGSVKWLREGFKTGQGSRYHKDQPKYIAKVTFQAAPSTRMSFLREFDDWIYDYRYQSVYRPKEASSFEYAWTRINNLSVFHSFSDRTFAELKIARTTDDNFYGGYAANTRETSGRYNEYTGKYSANYSWYDVYPDFRNAGVATLSHHADDFQGSHDFKFGVEVEQVGIKDEYGYNGGFYYRDDRYVGGEFRDYAYEFSGYYNLKGTRISGFVQDSWAISDNVTINPGLRYSIYRGHLETRGATLFKTQAFGPRIGFTWDIFGDHTTAFKAHWGRYYDKFTATKFNEASSGRNDFVEYRIFADGTWAETYRQTYSTITDIDTNLKYPGMSQFTMGLERELSKDIAAGVTVVYKKMTNFIDDMDVGSTWALSPFNYSVTAPDGTLFSGSGSAYVKTSPSSQDKWVITNPGPDKGSSVPVDQWRKYYGLFFTLEKRFSDNWMANVSYSVSQQKSTYSGRNPNSQANAVLRMLWNGEPVSYLFHNFKLYGTVILPFDLHLSPMITLRSAPRYAYYISAPISRSPSYNIEEPGSRTLDSVFDFNIRIEKSFTVKSDFRVGLVADLYNVFNVARIEGIQERVNSGNFGLVDDFNFGRQWRFGLRIYF